MTDTSEMAEWLRRIQIGNEETAGKSDKEILKGLTSLGNARQMLYDDLHYDITRKQFEGLKAASKEVLAIVKEERWQVRKDGVPTGQVHYYKVPRNALGQFSGKINK